MILLGDSTFHQYDSSKAQRCHSFGEIFASLFLLAGALILCALEACDPASCSQFLPAPIFPCASLSATKNFHQIKKKLAGRLTYVICTHFSGLNSLAILNHIPSSRRNFEQDTFYTINQRDFHNRILGIRISERQLHEILRQQGLHMKGLRRVLGPPKRQY